MYVNKILFIILCGLAVPGVLLILSIIVIKVWPRSDDRKFLEKNDYDKWENSNSL